jgi:hypothetical protein
MPRFLANWEVESDLVLSPGQPFVRYDHPSSAYTVFLRNIPERRNEQTYLSMQFIFDAPALSEAKPIADEQAKEFLDYLTFVSNIRIRLRGLLQIFNWEPPETGMREALYYSRAAANSDAPFEALDQELLTSLAMLQTQAPNPRLRRALKWFANGVSSQYRDDQFSYFWFVVEVVAQIAKDASKVPDRCPTCRTPLYCPSCNSSPLHRPYPKQAIEQLFARYCADDDDLFYRKVAAARNMLLHGDEVHAIEEALDVDFSDLTNALGRFAWTTLLNQFVPLLLDKQPMFLQTSHYIYSNILGSANVHIGFVADFDNPDPAHFPKVEMSLVSYPREQPPNLEDLPKPKTPFETL